MGLMSRALRPATKGAVHHVYIRGVRVVLSHRGRAVPQWLAHAVGERFPADQPVRSMEVEGFLRQTFPNGSATEVAELALKVTRAMRAVGRPAP